jgi:hypothetical protein
MQEGVRFQGKSQHRLPPGTTLTRDQRYEQRQARRDSVGVPMHDPGSGQVLVSEPPLVGLPDLQRQVEKGEAMLGEDVSEKSSGLEVPAAGEARSQVELGTSHAYGVQPDTVGAARESQSSVPRCESRRERESCCFHLH